jgi:nucleotide-binding universal stress UspA family protein
MIKVSEANEPICVERILVSLDSSKHSYAALQAAVELARHYDATLKGIFVEDTTLLNLAEMPFHTEVGEYSATIREISSDGITRGILVQSQWVTKTFHKLIKQTKLQSEFSIIRGKVIQTIDQESDKCDLLIIGKSGSNPLIGRRLGSTTKAIIQKEHKSLLLLEEGNHLGNPIIILFNDSPLGKIGLETARDLLSPGETLVILLSEDNQKEFELNKKALSDWASENQINISIQTYKRRSFDQFIQMISGLKTGLFIMPHIQKNPLQYIIDTCLKKVSLPILLIRPPAEKNN